MTTVEDAATVLEGFVHDVANLPAEIAHLLEEIQAKDRVIQECRGIINMRDTALQKHLKANGVIIKHPKEEQYTKVILENYEKAQELQDQKVKLSEKATLLLDRHVKRLDMKVRDLINDGNLMADSQLPSLLSESPANLVGPASVTGTGANTPILPLGFGAGGSTNIANAAMARMANTAALGNRQSIAAPIAGMQPSPLSITSAVTQRPRETSVGATNDSKRRRVQASLGTIPIPASNLHQSSLGPGTPRQNTPISRAGSAGPRTKKSIKQVAPNQQSIRKKASKGGISKKSARRLTTGIKLSPSTTDNDEVSGTEGSGSEVDVVVAGPGHDGAADDDAMDEGGYEDEGDDNKLYCICHSVSHGNMVACDNENCPYEWFHWECVGMTQEPKGRWLCTECRKLPANQVKLAR